MSIYEALHLMESPNSGWGYRARELLKDEYVKNKCNRKRRLEEKQNYIHKYCKEINEGNGNILDLGPGPGEFLEICRLYGNMIFGIDGSFDDSFIGMGRNYLEYSRLMTTRQKIPVSYVSLEYSLEKGNLKFPPRFFSFINSQGSISYIFRNYLLNNSTEFDSSLKLHEQAPGVFKWEKTPALEKIINKFMSEMSRILLHGGHLLIYINQPKTTEELDCYKSLMFDKIKEYGFKLILEAENNCLHKLEKL